MEPTGGPISVNRETLRRMKEENTEVSALVRERGSLYGTPMENHSRTARLVMAYLEGRNLLADPLSSLDICALNILQKLSRVRKSPYHEDHWLDIEGYARNGLLIIAEMGAGRAQSSSQ